MQNLHRKIVAANTHGVENIALRHCCAGCHANFIATILYRESRRVSEKGELTLNPHMKLQAIISDSPLLSTVLDHWDRIGMPDARLVAGAIAQTVWNHAFGFAHDHGINDIDIVYFDGNDLSESAEADHSARIRGLLSNLPVWIDVKNQARVHIWYKEKFGHSITPYTSTDEAITTFPTTAAAVGIRPVDNGLDLFAPYGLKDLLAPVVRANKKQITREIYEKKIARWGTLWPDLEIIAWDP
ncbi:nucleotidyltransferase family protein [Rhizobium anhuiense]